MPASAQTGQPPTGGLTGHVLDAQTQQPARLAHVVLQPVVDLHSPALVADPVKFQPESLFRLQTVGLDGSFTIAGVPPGLYYVIAEQDGYVSPLSLFTREQLNNPDDALLRRIARYMTPVLVKSGEVAQADVRLIRGAVIAGSVHFEDGSPGVNVSMQLLQRDEKGNWVTARTNRLAGRMSSYTDDQGAYRFSGLPASEYMVRATVELNRVTVNHIFGSGGSTSSMDGYHLRIYPGDVFRPRDAKSVKVKEGETAPAVNIDVPTSQLFSLRGSVQRPDSAVPANSAHLTLFFADDGTELTSADVEEEDGSFRFDFVPAGNYTLKATRIAEVARIEVPNCERCMPLTRTETKVLEKFGDATTPIALTSDLQAVTVQATAIRKQ